MAEPGIYLIAACLMTYRPFLDKVGSKIKAQTKIGTQWPPSKPSLASGQVESAGHAPRGGKHPRLANRSPGSPEDYSTTNRDKGILLSNISTRADGFEQLPDVDVYPQQDHPYQPTTSPQNAAILKTTSIQMSWGTAGR